MSHDKPQAEDLGLPPLAATRLLDLERRLVELDERVANLVDKLSRLTQLVRSLGEEVNSRLRHPSPAVPAPPLPISHGMARVVQLVNAGETEDAQRELYALPEEELVAQPAVVTLVAAALFVQRGEYERGLQALVRARELTEDPRLLRVIELVQEQVAERN